MTMGTSILFRCRCGKEIAVDAESPEKTLECPGCKKALQTPRIRDAGAGEAVHYSCPACDQRLSTSLKSLKDPITCTKCHARVVPPTIKGSGLGLPSIDFQMTPKNLAIAAVGLAVIVGCCIVIARQLSRPPPAPPKWFMDQKATLILTTAPYTLKETTLAEQQKLPKDATGYFKLDGGLWSAPATCFSCKEMVPPAIPPPGTTQVGEFLSKQKCPKCGKAAYEPD
jgi:DNA-directed RNA polymerase subunit RPC12/RpoP